jgi:hypothetical protein
VNVRSGTGCKYVGYATGFHADEIKTVNKGVEKA